MNHDIDQLLNVLLGDPKPTAAPPKTSSTAPRTRSAASEESLRRVEEIMRSVELESSRRRAEQPPKKEYPKPQHEPVVVPAPISHFSLEPSQDTAVRMRDRLDESALPMIDSDKKPSQIIPPKPKAEPPKKKRKRKKNPVQQPVITEPMQTQQDIPAPASEMPKRKIPHIVIPDELPPDIPRDTTIADEIKRRQQEQKPDEAQPEPETVSAEPAETQALEEPAKPEPAVRLSVNEKANLIRQRMRQLQEEQTLEELHSSEEKASATESESPEIEENDAPALAEETASAVPEEEHLSLQEKADLLRESIRQMHEELSALPEPEELECTDEEETTPEPEVTEEEPEKKSSRKFGFFRRKEKLPLEDDAQTEDTQPQEEPADALESDVVSEEEEILFEDSLQLTEAAEAEDSLPSEEETEQKPVLRHLQLPAEEAEEKGGLFGLFSRKKKRSSAEPILTETAAEAADVQETSEISADEESAETEEPEPSERESVSDAFLAETDAAETAEEEPHEEAASSDAPIAEEETDSDPQLDHVPDDAQEPKPQEQPVSIDVSCPGDEAQKKKSALIAAIHAALDESAQELAEIKAEPIPEQSEIDVALGRPQFWKKYAYFMIGLLFTILAAVGLVTCILQGKRAVQNFASSHSLKSELEECLYPLAVVDCPPFGDIAELNAESALSAAMIDLLMYEDLSGYTCKFDVYSIPAEDVRAHVKKMFGDGVQIVDVTLHAAGETFYYDATDDCYNVPSSPVIFSYAPEVQEITRSGDQYTVIVDYYSDTAKWQQFSQNFKAASKTMKITMQEVDGQYRILSILNISEESQGV